MKPSILATLLLSALPVFAQETPKPEAAPTTPPPAATPTPEPKKEKPSPEAIQAELEAKFKTTLTNAVMAGSFSVVKDGKNESQQEDKYTIVGVNKLFGENWIIRARIQYGKRDITAPIPVKVKWAGDTPVITVDGFALPGGGNAYSARVLVYGNAYAGTWSAGDHGGLMSGTISPVKE